MHTVLFSLAISWKCRSEQRAVNENLGQLCLKSQSILLGYK